MLIVVAFLLSLPPSPLLLELNLTAEAAFKLQVELLCEDMALVQY